MAKKKVAAVVKIQIPAGAGNARAARRHRARPSRRGDHGLLQDVQRADREPAGHDRPRRDHDLRGPVVHVHPEDAADAGAAAPGGRHRQGVADARARGCRHGHRRAGRRDRQDQDARPQRQRPRGRQEAGRGHRPLDGHHRSSSRHHPPPEAPRRRSRDTREPQEANMALHGKRYTDAARTFDRDTLQTPAEAIDLAKRTAKAKFDETVELAVRLGVDPRKADQMVRGTVALPSGTGKDVRVAVFAAGDAAAEARAAGADIVGRRRPGRPDRGRDARLRRRHRHARPDAAGRPARPHARPPWPDAQPEDRHGDDRGRQGRRRVQGRQGRVPHRPLRQRPRADRQGELRRRRAGRQLPRRARRAAAGQAGLGEGPLLRERSRWPPRWARASRSTRTVCGTTDVAP